MSGDESVAEQVFEAGLEIINPGGEPDDLRLAAKGWRDLHHNLQTMFKDMDREVQRTLDLQWRGPAADAFAEHWKNLDRAMDKTLPQLPEAAKSLEEAADAIEEINGEIHEIYLEIGISIGISVGLSFMTMGFSAAAGAARAAQLATKAAKLAKTLGTILRKVGQAFKTLSRLSKEHRFLKNVLVNWTSNTGATVLTNALTGQDTNLGDAVWQGGLASVVGTGPALATAGLGAKVAPELASKVGLEMGEKGAGLTGDIVGGGIGNVAGGLAVDNAKNYTGDTSDDVDGKNMGFNAGINLIAGGAAGGAVHGANTHLPPGVKGPHFSVEGVAQGGIYGGAGAVAKPLHDFLIPPSPPGEDDAMDGAATSPRGDVKDVFG